MGKRGTAKANAIAAALGSGASGRAPFDPRAILTSIGEVVYDWDLVSDAITWGRNACDVLGVRELSGLSCGAAFALAVEADGGATRHEAILLSEATDTGSGVAYRTHYVLHAGRGRSLRVEDTGHWFADAEGRPAFAHGVLRIDRSRSAESANAVRQAGAREDFVVSIRDDVAEARRAKRPMSVLVLAVEELGRLNDDLGFEATDQILEEVAKRVRSVMRRRDRLARYAGNRFALALRSCSADQVHLAAGRVGEVIRHPPMTTAVGPLSVGLRIGAATAPDHATDASTLLRRAEEALAAAKRNMAQRFMMYDPTLGRETRPRLCGIEPYGVIDALNARRVLFAAQPVVDAQSRNVVFREALLRIRSEEGRLIRASDIMPCLERSGLVPLVDARMLELVADYLRDHPDERLAINASPLTIESPEWLDTLAAHLGARPGIASRMIIELTETAAVRDPPATRARLDAMKALGVAVAIDDFGAGHTSFKHLRSFPVDILKIDGAFVQNLSRSTDDRFFVRALVDLAHHLGIATVAEWVEDEETACMLTEWGIDYLQGDHCGIPLVAGEEPDLRARGTAAA